MKILLLFTVNPVVSSRGCTLSCKFFLSLHTTNINIRGDCRPGMMSLQLNLQVFPCGLIIPVLFSTNVAGLGYSFGESTCAFIEGLFS